MTEGSRAVGNATTGVESGLQVAASTPKDRAHGVCRNCGAALFGPYCAQCAQSAHVHRSLASVGHDLLHSVFHFEGKFWRTMPALILRPGELTRRYIDGERAKFVSPTATFLFTVFAMFAAFSLLATPDVRREEQIIETRAALANIDRKLAELRARLADPQLAAAERPAIEARIAELESWRVVTKNLTLRDADSPAAAAAPREITPRADWSAGLNAALQKLNEDPQLLLYKLKTNGYKFSWALIPLSLPFMWLLFCWRRDIHLYDHAVFVTYSLSFMMLFATALGAMSAVGVSEDVVEIAMTIIPPVHIYRQLRGAYGLSRASALVRLIFVLLAAFVVLGSFGALLLAVGVLG